MYQFDDIGSTYISLPPNLQTIDNECFGYVLDRQMKKFHDLAKKLTVWSDLDNVDPKYYDYLALCIKAPYYRSQYSNEVKLNLIKTAIETQRYAGTQRAIERLINTIFEEAYFIPWYEYGGAPYHFKMQVFDVLTEDATTVFTNVLKEVKAARSIMDEISISRKAIGTVYIGIAGVTSYKGETIRESSEQN